MTLVTKALARFSRAQAKTVATRAVGAGWTGGTRLAGFSRTLAADPTAALGSLARTTDLAVTGLASFAARARTLATFTPIFTDARSRACTGHRA